MTEDKMGGAIAHWLGFQEKIGRGFMMNEDAIKYPLSDYLVNDGGCSINSIELERAHPNFSNRLMDVAIINNQQISNAFELKLAKTTTRHQSERQRIFNDLMRMHLVTQVSTDKCYFIITGKSVHFQRDFKNLTDNTNLFYHKWFSFTRGQQNTFSVGTEVDVTYKTIYDSFVNKYSNTFQGNGQLQLPTQIRTTCEFITAYKPQFVPYMTGVWSVQ